MYEIMVESTCTWDRTWQPAFFEHPNMTDTVPLVAGLHTWSHNRFSQKENYLPLCRKYGFVLLLPEFLGSDLASNPFCSEAGCSCQHMPKDVDF